MYKLSNFRRILSSVFTGPILIGLLFSVFAIQSKAQDIDLLLKGGRVIDAKNKIDAK